MAAELKTPIQIGENFYGPRDLAEALRRKACDYVVPDFMRIAGVIGWLRASAIAGTAAVPMSTHLYPEVGAHMMRVTETAHWLAWQDWANPILQRPFVIRDGLLHIPDVPGVGLEWNDDAVSAHLVRRMCPRRQGNAGAAPRRLSTNPSRQGFSCNIGFATRSTGSSFFST